MRLRTISFLAIIALFLVFLTACTSRTIRVANAATLPEILDQQQTDTSRTFEATYIAQSFKPTLTVLTRVDFYFQYGAILSIYSSRTTQNGLRPGIRLGSASVSDSSLPRWAEFVFSSPISLQPENTYFIIIIIPNVDNWFASTEDLYPRGEAARYYGDFNGPWERQPWDFPFKTYGYTPALTIRTNGVSSHSPVAVTLNHSSVGVVSDSNPLEVSGNITWDDGNCTVIIGIDRSRILSIDPNTRYSFASWTASNPDVKWSDNPFTTHLRENQSYTANFGIQHSTNMTFRDNDGYIDLSPTYIETLAPNGSAVTFSSFKNQWMDDGTWTIKRVIWQGNNVKPLTDPIYTSTAGGEWSINCRVFPLDFTDSFHDNDGADLYAKPSSFKLSFPNGTTSTSLPLDSYLVQNGTTSWSSIMWQGSEVTPYTSFDATNGNPTVNCKIYSLAVDPDFYDNSGTHPITPSSWSLRFPNNTIAALSYPVTYNQIQSGSYSIQSVTWKKGDVLRFPTSYELAMDDIWSPKINCTLPTNLLLSLSTSTFDFGFKIEIDGNLTDNELGVSDAAILLSYSVTAGKSWNDITQIKTASDGRYSSVWIPQAAGNYVIRAVWAGNATYPASTKTINLAVIPFEEQNVFSVISNSTVSELSFESAHRELTFTVSGPLDTMGYADVYIAKTLIGNIERVEVKLNSTEIEYVATSLEDSWLIHFTYQHSTHTVSVNLAASAPPTGETPGIDLTPALLIATLAIVLIAVVILIRRRRLRRKTASAGPGE